MPTKMTVALGSVLIGVHTLGEPCFVQRPIAVGEITFGMHAADLDGDGDTDLIESADNVGLWWRENDGSPVPAFPTRMIAGADEPGLIRAADIDGDGDTDIVALLEAADVVVVYKNDGQAEPGFIRADLVTDVPRFFSIVDFDGDGDADLLIASGDGVAWHENDGSPGPSFTEHVITTELTFATAVQAADLDGDGDTDVVAFKGYPDDTAIWYENDGSPDPGFDAHLLTDTAFGLSAVDLADPDADGDADILLASSFDLTVAWYENDGQPDPGFTRRVINDATDSAEDARWIDVDGDGDLDVLARDRLFDPDISNYRRRVIWFENDGQPDPVFDLRVAASFLGGMYGIDAGDMDGDGDMDLLSNTDFTISWHEQGLIENTATGGLFDRLGDAVLDASSGQSVRAGPAAFCDECESDLDFSGKAITIESTGPLERNVATTTTIADGATLAALPGYALTVRGGLDVPAGATGLLLGEPVGIGGDVSIGNGGVLLAGPMLRLEGTVEFDRGTTIESQFINPRSVLSADVDGDGDLDILVATSEDDSVSWYENDGEAEPAFTRMVITDQAVSAFGVAASDIDGDGDLDVLSASTGDNSIAWHENDGNADPSFEKRIISVSIDGAKDVIAADLDGDGDADVVAGGFSAAGIGWFENDGAPDPAFTARTIATTNGITFSIHAADFDGDGDTDLAAVSPGSDRVAWYENDGAAPPAFTEHIIEAAFNPWDVSAADFDGDGDIDILTAASSWDRVAWHENDGAPDPTFTTRVISTMEERLRTVYPADIDGDGDIDVLSAAYNDRTVVLHENGGQADPVFTRRVLTTDLDGPESVAAGDLDGDGDLDVIACGSQPYDEVIWFENILISALGLDAASATVESIGDLSIVNRAVRVGPTAKLAAAGTLAVDRASLLSGSGTARAAEVESAGVVQPDPGQTLTIEGGYSQFHDDGVAGFDTGEFRVDLGAGQASTLDVSGPLALAGVLSVTADPGFDPPVGTVYTIMTSGQPVGTERFDLALMPGLPGGKFLRVIYDAELEGGTGEGPSGGTVALQVELLGEDLGFNAPDDLSVGGVSESAVLADMNADGLPDVVLTFPDNAAPQGAPGSVLVLLNGGVTADVWQGFTGGALQAPTGVDPSSVAVGELNGAGGPDIAVANRADGTVSILLNDGTGAPLAFAVTPFNENPAAVVIGDLDEDGFNDVAVAGDAIDGTGLLTVRLNDGTEGAWLGLSAATRDTQIGSLPTFMDIGDLDNDSCLDLCIGTAGVGGVNLLDNLAGGTGPAWGGFAAPLTFNTGQFPAAGDIGDLDNDSCLDLLVVDRNSGELAIILHTGGPGIFTFQPPAAIPAGPAPRSVVAEDLDGDGDADVALVTDSDDGLTRVVRLLRNDLDPGVGQLQFAPSTLVPTIGEPLLVLAGDVDGTAGQDLVAITVGSTEHERRGPSGPSGGVSTALNTNKVTSGCNAADLTEPFGLLDLSDVTTFASAFTTSQLLADVNGDGLLDLADVVRFVESFVAGCP